MRPSTEWKAVSLGLALYVLYGTDLPILML
jgi:hypothetical protein